LFQELRSISRLNFMRLIFASFLLQISLRLSVAAESPVNPVPALDPKLDGVALFRTICAACHGERGEGKEELQTPSIAGLPSYYVINQLHAFRHSHRGIDPADAQGLQMAAIAKALGAKQIADVARHLQTLPIVLPKQREIEGADLGEGRWLFEMRCMECHRFNASGELAFASPPLVGLPGWYLMAQLRKFKAGQRGAHIDDTHGAKMNFAVQFIENEAMLRNVVAYILSLNPVPPGDPFAGNEDEPPAPLPPPAPPTLRE